MDTILKLIISKGIILQRKVAGVTVLILYTSSDAALYLYQDSLNILDGFKISKGHTFTKMVDEVTVLVLCTLSDTRL